MEKAGETWMKQRKGLETVGLVGCTNRVVKMKEHLLFRKEFSILCIENKVVFDCVVLL